MLNSYLFKCVATYVNFFAVTFGVKAFPIEGPLGNERYRLSVGMTEEDRAYRAQWLKDQVSDCQPNNNY